MGARAHGLRLALGAICPASSGRLDREDVRWGLHDFGVPLDEEQSQILMDAYDRDGSGLVRYSEKRHTQKVAVVIIMPRKYEDK